MNQVAQRNIPEEWTPEMWQAKVTAMAEQLEDYKKAENAREKEFRELEREVYNLKQDNLSPMSQMTQSMSRIEGYRERQQAEVGATYNGVPWLR